MRTKLSRYVLTGTLVLILTLALAGAAFASENLIIPLHNDVAEVGTNCPTDGGAYWHFVVSPNNGESMFIIFHLNLGDPTPYDLGFFMNGDQLDNVFVQVPDGKTIESLLKSGSSAEIVWSEKKPEPDNFRLSHICPGAKDLTISKTAVTSYIRTFDWTIDKSADTDTVYSVGGGESGVVNYTVTATKIGYTDSGWTVAGDITVNNPNKFAVSGVNISDGACVVTDGANLTIPAEGSVTAAYTCPLDGAYDGTNIATVAWDDIGSPNTSATASADYKFSDPTKITNAEIDVTDTFGGPWRFTDTGTVTYSKTFTDPAGVCTSHENTAVITQTGAFDSVKVKDCQGADLTVRKTAIPTFTRTFDWDIDKSADKPTVYSVGGGESEAVNYTVSVTKNAGVDSGWAVNGDITITNPNDWQDVVVDVTDALPGGVCTVTNGTQVTVPASGSVKLAYTCTFAEKPEYKTDMLNTATVEWDAVLYYTPNGLANGEATFQFTEPTTKVNDEIDVTDTFFGSWHFTESGSVSYSKTFTDPAGTCTPHENTATIVQLKKFDSVKVEDCQGADLTLTKTAIPSYDLTYAWRITKEVDKTTVKVDPNQPAVFNYTVAVSHNDGVESNWQVKGDITVTNPNDWQDVIVDVTDVLPGGTCAVIGGMQVNVPAGGSVTLAYSCAFESKPQSGTNTATATWDAAAYHTPNGSASGAMDFTFGAPTNVYDECVDVKDSVAGYLGKACVGEDNPKVFNYSSTFYGPALGGICVDHDNIATFITNDYGETGSADATVTVCSWSLRLTPGYWKNHLALTRSIGCAGLPKGTSCSNNGPFASAYLPQLLGNFSVPNILTSAKIFVGMNCSSAKDQDSVGCLAGHLLATKFNVANGANTCIATSVVDADAFLTKYNYSGPTGKYTLTIADRALAITIKNALDAYNNNGGCH